MKKFLSPFNFTGNFLSAGPDGFGQFQFVTPDSLNERLAGKMEVRANESIANVISGIEPGQTIQLAPDTWTYNSPLVITKSCAIIGHPLGTKIKRGEGLTTGPMVSIEADNVVLQNIYFEDETALTDVVCISSANANLFVSQCTMMNFSKGIENTGGSGHSYSFNSIGATSVGISLSGTSRGHRLSGNSVVMTPDSVPSIQMGISVSATAVNGNNCNSGISFHNTGAAQTFASPGGLSNHVAGNVAALTETT